MPTQTDSMKDEILEQLHSQTSTVRVVFATVPMGMGVDICIVAWFTFEVQQ